MMRIPLPLYALALIATFLFPQSAAADGFAWKHRSGFPLRQRQQMAAIAHRDGTEKLILAAN